jgi:hypothetical protein
MDSCLQVNWGATCKRQRLSSLELMAKVMPQATCVLGLVAFVGEGRRLRAYPFTPETGLLLLLCGVTAFFTSWTG